MNKISWHNNASNTHATTWMNLKDFMQSESHLNQKSHTVWFHMYEHRSIVIRKPASGSLGWVLRRETDCAGSWKTFFVDGEVFFMIILSWLKRWLQDDTICQKPSTLECVNFILCKWELSEVDFTKTNPGWSQPHIPQTWLRRVVPDWGDFRGTIELLVAGSPEHRPLTMPSPAPCQAARDLVSSVQCLGAQKHYPWSQGSWFLFCLHHLQESCALSE